SLERNRAPLCGLGLLGPVLGAALLAILNSGRVQASAHHVVAHAGQVLHSAAADEHYRMLLQIVSLATDVADDLEAVGETHLGDLPKGGVRLLRRRRVHARADAALLRALLERRYLALRHRGHPALAHQLIDCRHLSSVVRGPSPNRTAFAAKPLFTNQSGP